MDRFVDGNSVSYVPPGKLQSYLTQELIKETPEEHVRQRVIRSLVEEYGYDLSQIRVNFKLAVGGKRLPVDIAVFHDGKPPLQENIYIIVETKRPEIKSTDKESGIDQLGSYVSSAMNCEFALWTNGLEKLCFQKIESKTKGQKYEPKPVIDIPIHGKTIEEYEKPDFTQLRPATELKSVFKRINDYIYGRQGMREDQAFHELLKLIFCKVYDERSDEIHFYVTNKEIGSDMGAMSVKKRIDELFDSVRKQYQYIFKNDPKILLNPRVLAYVVGQLQNYYLLRTDADVKGDAYEELVGKNLRGSLGEYFTPRNICRLAVRILLAMHTKQQIQDAKIIDPACGTGGFLISVIDTMRQYYYDREIAKDPSHERAMQIVDDEIRMYCARCLYGIDFNEVLVQAAQMNEVIHGNGSSNLFSVDSLKAPGEWPIDVAEKVKLGSFDMLMTNPPFGENIIIDDRHLLSQYDLAHVWKENDDGILERTDDIKSRMPPQLLFIERSVQLLKPNGKLAIVLPDSVLSNPGLKYVRHWILTHTKVIASIDLAKEAFEPSTGTKTSLLILERKNETEMALEKKGGKLPDYDVFMAIAGKVGKNSRGDSIFKRTPEGEMIEIEKETYIVKIVDRSKVREKLVTKEPILDDDLPHIGDEFVEWWNRKGRK
ncbi:type I restriction-modification system methyltransferase subunit [Candidatus Nitrososphaera evergladensis SR1]|uniref:Type I restriction-modification system methyltransferase subunit n=1 Tax=Candidatus Nitrososphaera evergladensis SR1 TaxID=1459636 RepID=A0A075MNI1_9ARCH|nr:N-6 DNA methylase [Candidatus Nitrososphaera evergladensis]AIF82367.1 type I restriction-modification system methyltransferase subunit [Candidatus Nitrososphaera evergladensis SR1]AIF83216.1 type I restriction-modification system methyltransferase subunit [Candidatus Nitrososphaera evergladensis SR1]